LLPHIKWFATLSVLWLVIGTVLDVYNLARAASTSSILANAGSAALVTTLIYLAIPWLTPPILHRTYALGLVLLGAAVLVGWRAFYARALVQPAFRQRGLFVGNAGPALALAHVIHEAGLTDDANPFRGTGYEIVGRVADETRGDHPEDDPSGMPLLGDTGKLVRLSRQYGIDEIILAPELERDLARDAREVFLDCRELGLRINNLAHVYERLTGRLPVDYARYDLQLLLTPADTLGSRLYGAAKRVLDIVLALVGLVMLGLILPVVAVANALKSPGPLFYRQERVGKGGRPFTLIKLRSMVTDAERCSGAVWCGEADPRITPVGRFLRKTRLDEAPQLFNVLRGEMSLVGPRPERPHFVGQLARTFPIYRARHAVKPGITGWAQVHHEYGDSIEDARIKLEYDLFYVKHAKLYLDLLILLHTVRVVLGLKGR
jgi:exopolysaccharide biosynthesis polyprenyl glycosylphosphotransferase